MAVAGVVLTGAPAAGKSTVGRALAEALPGIFLSLDVLKEGLFAESSGTLTGWPLRQAAEARLDAALAGLGAPGTSSGAGGVSVGGAVAPAVVDIWVDLDRDGARVRALLARRLDPVVEVRCVVPADVAVARFFARQRGGPHDNSAPGLADRIRAAAEDDRPLGIGPRLLVPTDTPVDVTALRTALLPLLIPIGDI